MRSNRIVLFLLSALVATGLGRAQSPDPDLLNPHSEAARQLRDAMATPTNDWPGYLPVTEEDLKRPKVNLRFVVWDGEEGRPVLQKAVREFEKHYPWVKVKFEGVSQNFQEKLLNQVAGECAPDVAMMDMNGFNRLAKRDAIYGLNAFIEKTPGFNLRGYYKPLVDAHSFRGELYVLPRDIAPIGIIYYNKEIFRKAGIPYPDGTWTWDFKPRPELREKCFTWVMQQLTKKDKNGKVLQYGFASGWPGAFLDTLVFSQGARYADDQEEPTKVLFDDPRIVNAVQFMQDIMLKEKWFPSPTELRSGLQASAHLLFAQGKLAMYEVGIWEVPAFRRELVPGKPEFFEWDIALAPAYKDGGRGAPTGGSGYAILKQTKHPWEAWLLTMWMAGPPGMAAMANAGIAQPGIRAQALQEPWTPGPNTPEEQAYPPSRIVTDEAVPYVVFNPTSDLWPEVVSHFNSQQDSVWLGIVDAKEAMRVATERAQARLDVLRAEQHLPKANWALGGTIGAALVGAILFWIYWPERKIRRTPKEKHESRTAYGFLMPWLLGMLFFTLGPMILSLLMSFMDWDAIRPAMYRGVKNYVELATVDPWFWKSLLVTSIYTVVAVPLGLVVSLALALLLNVKVAGMPLYRTFYYLPSLASGVASALIWRRVFQPEGGLLNTLIYGPDGNWNFLGLASLLKTVSPDGPVNWLGNERTALAALILMSVWGAGGAMLILLAGLQGIPQHYYEAATIDGASPWIRFRSVTIPLLSPSLLFCLITGFIGSFQVFTQSFVMTSGGPNGATLFYMLHLYNNAFMSIRMGYASAMAWVLFFVILIFTLVQLRLTKYVYYEAEAK